MGESLRTLKGVGEKTEKLFQKIGISDTESLLRYYPRNYDEYETPADIADLKEGTVKAVSAAVCSGVYVNPVRGKQVISVTVCDSSGTHTPKNRSVLPAARRNALFANIVL